MVLEVIERYKYINESRTISMDNSLTIITPTYNRAYTLEALYHSLIQQTDLDFLWLVVDDGSTDSTKELISQFIEQNIIKIRYIKQNNQGKHIAWNTGVSNANTAISFILDSDDTLVEEAVEIIKNDWKLAQKDDLIGIAYLWGAGNREKVVGKEFPKNYMIDTLNNVKYNLGIDGDKAIAYDTEKLKSVPFPQIPGERFLSEGVVWKQLSHKGKMLFINKIIYIANYAEDGLTKSGSRVLLIKNPIGLMLNCKLTMTKEFTLKVRVKFGLLYIAYGFFAKKKVGEIISESEQPRLIMPLIPFGWLIYRVWGYKYKDKLAS